MTYITEHIRSLPNDLAQQSSAAYKNFTAGGLRPSPCIDCVCRLKKKKHSPKTCERLPRQDHDRGFQNPKTGERVLTHHPYISEAGNADPLTIEILTKESEAFAARHGLTVRVSMDSWYYPGWTALVEYRVVNEIPASA